MKTFADYKEAVAYHDDDGGYLLNLGWDTAPGSSLAQRHYVVCDEMTARDYGRTPEQLAALAPDYREDA